jgi:DNA topoisomerase-1
MQAFAAALPAIRARTTADLARPGLPREKVLAAVVQLLEKSLIRIGNEEYARDNHSFGLTTMRDTHARIRGGKVHFVFRGKSRVSHAIDLHDARLAKIVKSCRDLPGQDLFQYVDGEGRHQAVGSADVNGYLREISGQPFTSKDFRTWAGTVLAARALADAVASRDRKGPTNTAIVSAMEAAAGKLGNTVAVCRKCYVHPGVIVAYLTGGVFAPAPRRGARQARTGLSPDEAAVVALLRASAHHHALAASA